MRLLTQAPAAALLSLLCSTVTAIKKGADVAPLPPGMMCEHMVWECVTYIMRFEPNRSMNEAWDLCRRGGLACPHGLGTPAPPNRPHHHYEKYGAKDVGEVTGEAIAFDEEKDEADVAAINAYLDSDAYKASMAAASAAAETDRQTAKRNSIVFPGKKNQALSPEGCNALLTVCPKDTDQNKEFCIRMWCEKQREAQFCDMCTSRHIEWEYNAPKPTWEWEPDSREDWRDRHSARVARRAVREE